MGRVRTKPDTRPSFRDFSVNHWKRTVKKPTGLYVIRCGDFIKVGAATHPYARMSDMQNGNPHTLELVLFAPGAAGAEKAIHARLKKWHHHREWFRMDKALERAIRIAARRYPPPKKGASLWDEEPIEAPLTPDDFLPIAYMEEAT